VSLVNYSVAIYNVFFIRKIFILFVHHAMRPVWPPSFVTISTNLFSELWDQLQNLDLMTNLNTFQLKVI